MFGDQKKIFAVATLEAGDLIEASCNWFFKGAFSTTPVVFQVKRTYHIDASHGFVFLNAFNNCNKFAKKNVSQFPITLKRKTLVNAMIFVTEKKFNRQLNV